MPATRRSANTVGVSPLPGIRYAESRLDSLLSPPYDVVSPQQWEALVGANPHNVLRIEHPTGDPSESVRPAEEAYARAARTLSDWLSTHVLTEDREPSVYVVEHEFPTPWGTGSARRTGILALIPARPWEEGAIKPHERTFAGPKQDRLALLRATHVQTSPIFGLWDQGQVTEILLHEIAQTDPLQSGSFTGDLGVESARVWRLGSDKDLDRLTEDLAQSSLYIADGHHRYETAVAFGQELLRTSSDSKVPHVLTYLCSATDPGLFLLPTHRIVSAGAASVKAEDDLRSRLGSSWKVEETHTPILTDPEPPSLNVFTVATIDGTYRVARPRRGESPRGRLDVSALHDEVLPALGVSQTAAEEGVLTYERDAGKALGAVRDGQAGLAVLMSPPSVAEMVAVADAGETMPQKSTYFYPKVPTGLVLWRVTV